MSDVRNTSISIVVPSYNQGKFCRDTLESLKNQKWPNLQIIFVDGGSTDNTLEIVEDYRDIIDQIIVEKDEGAADAINKGFKRANGDLVGWLNTDDFHYPGALKAWATAFHGNPDASFYTANGNRVDINGDVKEAFFKNGVSVDAYSLAAGLDYILQPSTIMNGRHLNEVGYLDKKLRWGFDWELFIRLSQLAEPVAIEEIVAASREYQGTLTESGGVARGKELLGIGQKYSALNDPPGGRIYYYQAKLEEAQAENQSTMVSEFAEKIHNELPRLAQMGLAYDGLPFRTLEGQLERIREQSDFTRERVLIDFSALVTGASGGIVMWAGGVLEKWLSLFRHHDVIMFKTPHFELDNFPNLKALYSIESGFPERLLKLRETIANFQPTIVVRAYPDADMGVCELEKQMVFVPDMQHEFFPENFERQVLADRRMGFARTLRGAGAIITLTEHSKKTIDEFEATNSDDVFIVPAASPEELDVSESEIVPPDTLDEKARGSFFYFPANFWPHKNHKTLFAAFEAIAGLAEMQNVYLVLSGHSGGWEEYKAENVPHDRIVHVGFVSEGEKVWLLKNTIAVTYFSLFEGFGIPVLEAFIYDTPVLASNVTSIPEVGGEALVTCDPLDIGSIATLLLEAAADPVTLKRKTVPYMQAQLDRYHWTGAAWEFEAGLQRLSLRNRYDIGVVRSNINLDNAPLVSVVTPSYNHARFIRATLESILAQSYRNIQYIVMDGGSSDNTVEILEEFEAKFRARGIEYSWYSEKDRGQTHAINKGMKLAKGKILCYLNSDDVLLPTALESVAPYFIEDMNLGLIYGEANYIDVDGFITGNYNTKPYNWQILINECCICQPSAFWTKELWDEVGKFDESIENSMDYEYWLRAGSKSELKILHIPFFLAQSRLHEDIKTFQNRGKIFTECFEILGKHANFVGFGWHVGYWNYLLNEGAFRWLPKTKHHWWFVLPAMVHTLLTNIKVSGVLKGYKVWWGEVGHYIKRRFNRKV